MSISIDKYKIMFSGSAFKDVFPLKPNFLKNILSNFRLTQLRYFIYKNDIFQSKWPPSCHDYKNSKNNVQCSTNEAHDKETHMTYKVYIKLVTSLGW